MTEQEFQKQVWRPYDQITTADGVKGKVLNVCFTTKSVRAFISGAPEWVRCELIETHTTGKGADGDDSAIIEELQKKVLNLQDTIEKQQEQNAQLAEKLNMISGGELIKNVNVILSQLQEKKKRIEKIETCMVEVEAVVEKIKAL
jgi:seryl-tRNA synthetase